VHYDRYYLTKISFNIGLYGELNGGRFALGYSLVGEGGGVNTTVEGTILIRLI
jgi:hypothetical protein